MHRFIVITILTAIMLGTGDVLAYKVYWYDENGYRVYKTVDPKDYSKNKKKPKRAYTRQPRNREITDEMRARRRTFYYAGKY